MIGESEYRACADALLKRMLDFAKAHPEVYRLESAYDLFALGFQCDDLQPSLAQASWALAMVKAQNGHNAPKPI